MPKNNVAGNFWNALEREPVETRVLNHTASEASFKPKQRSYGKTKKKKKFWRPIVPAPKCQVPKCPALSVTLNVFNIIKIILSTNSRYIENKAQEYYTHTKTHSWRCMRLCFDLSYTYYKIHKNDNSNIYNTKLF